MSAAKPAQLLREEPPQGAAPRDAAVYFRNGKLLAVETAAGTFSLAELQRRKLLSFTDGMILNQLAARVDTLIGQLEATS